VIGTLQSPRITAPNQTLLSAFSTTLPITVAVGAIHALGSAIGRTPSSE